MSKKEKQDLPLIFEIKLSINILGFCLGLCGSTIMWHKKDSSVNEFVTKDIQQNQLNISSNL